MARTQAAKNRDIQTSVDEMKTSLHIHRELEKQVLSSLSEDYLVSLVLWGKTHIDIPYTVGRSEVEDVVRFPLKQLIRAKRKD